MKTVRRRMNKRMGAEIEMRWISFKKKSTSRRKNAPPARIHQATTGNLSKLANRMPARNAMDIQSKGIQAVRLVNLPEGRLEVMPVIINQDAGEPIPGRGSFYMQAEVSMGSLL